MTTDEFDADRQDWIATAQASEVRTGSTPSMVYQPMLELLDYLRANGFKTFIVSGGGVEFMRALAEQRLRHSAGAGRRQQRQAEVRVARRQAGADQAAGGRLHRRQGGQAGRHPPPHRPAPILAFGNSDGDLEMLQCTTAGAGPRFALIVHHDDAEREFAYDRDSTIGKFDKAWDEAWRRAGPSSA